MKKATHQQTKEHNRNLVLRTIIGHESVSRAELARITGLTRATISDIVVDLLSEGLVSEIGMGLSTGGKSPILLSLQEDAKWLIGLDLAQYQFHGALVNLRGKIRDMVNMSVNERTGEEVLPLVYEILDLLMKHSERPLLGIGIGTAGLVNTKDGIVLNADHLDWKNIPLTQLLESRYHLPVYILNDSQAAAIGEYSYGAGHRIDDQMIVINVRHGIGAGIIINGTLFHGDGGSAGEIGHISVVHEGGLLCRCGKYGCLETVASAQALIQRARIEAPQTPGTLIPHLPQEISLNTIEKAFRYGDPLANKLVINTSYYLGMAIANLVGVLNIQRIILSGDMTIFGDVWLEKIKEFMFQFSLPDSAQNTQVEIGRLGGNGIILGASAMLANNYSLLFNRQLVAEG